MEIVYDMLAYKSKLIYDKYDILDLSPIGHNINGYPR